MKTDRELLELAARAMGYPVVHKGNKIPNWVHTVFVLDGREWNPLTDDGDALRLAVKLRIVIDWADMLPTATMAYSGSEQSIVEPHFDNPYAATRRAIVRAAAAIGEAMP